MKVVPVAALLLLAGAAGLVLGNGMTQERVEALEEILVEEQLGTVAQVQEPTQEPAPEPSGSLVPVTEVDEAWDEAERQEAGEETPAAVTAGAAEGLSFRNETDYEIDLDQLPALPQYGQTQDPLVLIMHTHGSEGYRETAEAGYRSQNPEESVLAVGEVIADALEAQGISVLHDTTLWDYPEYTGAYTRARAGVEALLEEYPNIFLVLDVHRDAVEDDTGAQLSMDCQLQGEAAAQLMLVVGTDAGGLTHPDWQTNLSLGVVLQSRLAAAAPELMRPLNLRQERFNQDLGGVALLVEVGASGNTLEEAKRSAAVFAQTLGGLLQDCKG